MGERVQALGDRRVRRLADDPLEPERLTVMAQDSPAGRAEALDGARRAR
jgi:hypothetical protein